MPYNTRKNRGGRPSTKSNNRTPTDNSPSMTAKMKRFLKDPRGTFNSLPKTQKRIVMALTAALITTGAYQNKDWIQKYMGLSKPPNSQTDLTKTFKGNTDKYSRGTQVKSKSIHGGKIYNWWVTDVDSSTKTITVSPNKPGAPRLAASRDALHAHDATAWTPPAMPNTNMFAVTCPPNYSAGMSMEVHTPTGATMQVNVPPGYMPGQQFIVEY